MSAFACVSSLVLLLSGCASFSGKDGPPVGIGDEVRRSERLALESQTLARLSAMERSLNDFIRAERRIPEKLEELVPKYLAEIPETALDVRAHKDTSEVRYYPPELIVDGQINGAALKDTGGWGYAHNARQVIVFVDCTHKMSDGKLWYRARGVY